MLNLFQPPAGLLGSEEEAIRQQMQMQGLLGLASGFFQSAQPSPVRQSIGTALTQGLAAGQQAANSVFEQAVRAQMMREQIAEAQRKRAEEEAIRKFLPQIYQMESGPTQEPVVSEQGTDFITRPGTPGGINYDALRQLMVVAPERGTKIAEGIRALQPKTSVQSIFDDKGREIKVRYNEDTGAFSPIGGAKAESFVQIDRGDVIELRRPGGEVVGTLPKGIAPVAPSYTMTDMGQVLNTRTGALVQPRDEKGNPITIDTTAKASEDERKSAGFYTRMKDATATVNSPALDSKGKPIMGPNNKPVTIADAGAKPEIVAETIGGILPNWMGGRAAQNFATSAVRQQYQQAQENWVSANLRAESGAAIGVEEMQKEIRKYFPQVGDSNTVIQQKERARIVAEQAMRQRAGRAIVSQPRNLTVDY